MTELTSTGSTVYVVIREYEPESPYYKTAPELTGENVSIVGICSDRRSAEALAEQTKLASQSQAEKIKEHNRKLSEARKRRYEELISDSHSYEEKNDIWHDVGMEMYGRGEVEEDEWPPCEYHIQEHTVIGPSAP